MTNAAHLSVQGTTLPGVTVALEAGADGQFDEGTTQADAAGHFTLPVTLSEGTNTLLVRAADGFGQEQTGLAPPPAGHPSSHRGYRQPEFGPHDEHQRHHHGPGDG